MALIKIEASPNAGCFRVDGIDYIKGNYGIKYDNTEAAENIRNFSLYNIHDSRKIISSRGYAEIDGVNSWFELLSLLSYIGALASNDINIQDQTTPIIIASFSKEIASTIISVNTILDSYEITIASTLDFAVGLYVSIFNIDANRFYLGNIMEINGNTLTLDTPLDFGFVAGSFVTCGTKNMSVNGSTTPVVFGVRNTDEQIGSAFDITRIILHCETSGGIDLSKFGDISGGILRGIVLRKVDGVTRNVFNAKTNGELKSLMYDFDIQQASGNQQDGFTGRLTFGGQSKLGVVIRLEPGEDLQLLVQDDLSSLQLFEIICEGHVVE